MYYALGAGLLGLAVVTGGSAAEPSVGRQAKAPWHNSYETAKAEARRTSRPMLVVFR